MAVNWDEFTPVEESSASDGSIDWNQFTPIDEPRRTIEPPSTLRTPISPAEETISMSELISGAGKGSDQALGRFGQAFFGGMAAVPEAAAIIAQKPAAFMEKIIPLEGGVERPVRENLLYRGGQQLRNEAAGVFPVDESRPKSFVTDTLPSGAGSMASFLAGGAALKGSRLLTTPGQIAGGVAALGASTGGAEAYREAIEAGADDDTAFKVFAANAALGTTEAVPIAGWLNRLNKASGNKLKQAIIDGSEEAVQEIFQQFGGNLVASKTFDPDRKLLSGTGEGGAAGFTLGSLMSFVVSAIGGRRGRSRGADEVPSTEPAPSVPSAIPPTEAPATAIDEAAINRGLEKTAALTPIQAADLLGRILVTEKDFNALSNEEINDLNIKSPHEAGQIAGLEMTEADEKRLQEKYDAANKANLVATMQQAQLSDEGKTQEAQEAGAQAKAEFYKTLFYGGMLMSATKGQWQGTGTNREGFLQRLKEAQSKTPAAEPQPTETQTEEETQEAPITESAAQTEQSKPLISMGGELATAQPTGTTLANASGEQERTDFGLPAAYPKVSRKMLPVWNASAEVLIKNPKAGENLAAELKINPERGMTDEDSALLLRHKVALENAKNQAAEDSITAGAPEAKQAAMDRFDNISNQLLDLLDAAKFRGSQWGREGRWRQALAFEDYSFESMRRQKRMKADRELTPEEEAETKREYEDIAAKQKAAEAARVKDEQSAREAQAKEVVAETIKTARTRQTRQKAAGVVRDLTAEQAEIVAYLKDHFIENGDLSDTQSSIKKLMELLVEREGITERLPLETRVHEILSGVDPTLTREGTLDLMSGYGKSKLPSQEPAKKIVRDISQQIISVRKLLDYFKGKRPSLTGMLRDAPSDIQRGWISMVNEAKKVFKLDVPVDNARSIKSATDAINTRLKNRISDLKQEIAARQKIIRERSPSPYNAETLKLRQELESLQAQHAEIFGSGLTPAQQLDRLEKSAERQIKELERQIQSGEIFSRSRQVVGLSSDKLDAAKAKIEELKLQRQFAREALQPRPEPEVAKNEARISALDKQIAAIEKQLADDAVFSKSKKPRTPSEDARVLEREKKLAELKQERQFARERNQPGMEPHEQFLLNYLLRVRQREAAYKEKLAKGDFEKKVKPKRELSPAVLSALADVEKAKSDFQRGLHEYDRARRSRSKKIWDAIQDTRNAFVNIVSSYDFSAPRQAFFALMANTSRLVTHPTIGAKLLAVPFRNMFQAWSNENKSATIEQWIKNRPNALSGADKAAGIQYTDIHSTTFSKREENARSILDEWAKLPLRTGNAAKSTVTFAPKVGAKGVRMSNRAFITYLNTTRALLFDELLRANYQDRAPTDLQLKSLGEIVNLSTGRGNISPKTAEVTSQILWAPSLLASRAQVIFGQPFVGKVGREAGGKARLIAAKEYARWITSAALLFAVSRMFDDKEEEEPTSSDFGKVVRGNVRIDPWGGNQQLAVLMARIKQGQTTSIEGQARDLDKTGMGEVIFNFFKNKARPDLVAAVKAAIAVIDLRKDEKDVRVTPAEAVKGAAPVPLAIREVIEVMRDRGMTEGAIIEAMALFGAGVSVYEEREAQK